MYEELVKTVRLCVEQPCCDNCPRYDIDHAQETNDCCVHLLEDAADALEAAEQRIAKLEAQLPKEGEWQDEQRGRWIYAKCNLCGKVQDVRSNYCPNCGARMRGEHDEQIH